MLEDLESYESRTYSQNGEDGILARVFEVLGTTNRFFVEFGVGTDGEQRNTRLLERRGWRGLLLDHQANSQYPTIHREHVTVENINRIFAKYGVPYEFDLLSIDIDGNDYWVWNALSERYNPRVVVIEYNSQISIHESRTIAYDPEFRWNGTTYYGASLFALRVSLSAKATV